MVKIMASTSSMSRSATAAELKQRGGKRRLSVLGKKERSEKKKREVRGDEKRRGTDPVQSFKSEGTGQ